MKNDNERRTRSVFRQNDSGRDLDWHLDACHFVIGKIHQPDRPYVCRVSCRPTRAWNEITELSQDLTRLYRRRYTGDFWTPLRVAKKEKIK